MSVVTDLHVEVLVHVAGVARCADDPILDPVGRRADVLEPDGYWVVRVAGRVPQLLLSQVRGGVGGAASLLCRHKYHINNQYYFLL